MVSTRSKSYGDVAVRAKEQTRGIFPQAAEVIGKWQMANVDDAEKAIHYILKARGRWLPEASGTEWFNTTVPEIETIIQFINSAEK